MKRKIWSSILVFVCAILISSVCIAASAKDEAAAYLQKSVENTAKANSLTYDISMVMTGPLADFNIQANGKYNEPLAISGKAQIMLDMWIINTKLNMSENYYIESAQNNLYFYYKIKPSASGPAGNVLPKDINPDQWYITKFTMSDGFIQELNKQKSASSTSYFSKDLKKAFMYKPNDDTVKIYASYDIPLLREEYLKNKPIKETTYVKSDEPSAVVAKETNLAADFINDNPQLRKAVLKPRTLTYEITVDAKSQQIKSVHADMSEYIQKAGSEVLDAIPFENIDKKDTAQTPFDGTALRSILKNYLKRSTLKMDINISDVNTTEKITVPQQVKDSAIAPPVPASAGSEQTKHSPAAVANDINTKDSAPDTSH